MFVSAGMERNPEIGQFLKQQEEVKGLILALKEKEGATQVRNLSDGPMVDSFLGINAGNDCANC
jgi:hypothetical protein